MTFNETEHPRATDGKFAEKTGAAPDVTLADPYGEMTRIIVESDEFWNDEEHQWNADALAQKLRAEGLSTLSAPALSAIIRQDRWRSHGGMDTESLSDEILRPRSEDEISIAEHLAGGSGVVFNGSDSTTPDGYSVAFGTDKSGMLYSYLLDDETKSIVGRIEANRRGAGAHPEQRAYTGSGLKGGYYTGSRWSGGNAEAFEEIVREHERMKAVQKVDAELDAASDARISAYAARKAVSDSVLEHVLRNEHGIPIMTRTKLIQAYESDNGRTALPELLHEHASRLDSDMLRDLRRLAADPRQ